VTVLFRNRTATARPATEQRSNISFSQFAGLLMGQAAGGLIHTVDGDTSMRHDAVWSCRTRIAQDVSMMPVDVVRYVNGRRQDVTPVPQIIAAPSVSVAPLDWRYQLVDSWLGWGNAWGRVTETTGNGMYPSRIELHPPSSVTYFQLPGDRLRFLVDGVERFLWPVGDLWHVPAYTAPGSPVGLSPIQYHAATITGGLNAGKFGSDFFIGGGLPSSILTVNGQPDKTQADTLKARLLEITRGSREPLVLPAGTEYQQISVNPEDSQFIDTQRYSVEQVCRIFGEDPADHGASSGGSSITYANRSDADLARYKRRQFWVTKMQDCLTALLPRPQVVKLNTSSSLMMTAHERHELHALRLKSETTTVNAVRVLEDEVPFDDPKYDTPGIPALLAVADPATPRPKEEDA